MPHDIEAWVAHKTRQSQQLDDYLKFKELGGDEELPVQLTTLMKPEQQRRIRWIKDHCIGKILEVGCSWGYITAVVGGSTAVDLSPRCIELAKLLQPDKQFVVGDALKLPLSSKEYDTVIMAEVLEHIPFEKLKTAIGETCRVGRKRLLITVPDGRYGSADALNPRHAWVADMDHITQLLEMLPGKRNLILNDGFVLIRADIDKFREDTI